MTLEIVVIFVVVVLIVIFRLDPPRRPALCSP
jgi:hypothetical protein